MESRQNRIHAHHFEVRHNGKPVDPTRAWKWGGLAAAGTCAVDAAGIAALAYREDHCRPPGFCREQPEGPTLRAGRLREFA